MTWRQCCCAGMKFWCLSYRSINSISPGVTRTSLTSYFTTTQVNMLMNVNVLIVRCTFRLDKNLFPIQPWSRRSVCHRKPPRGPLPVELPSRPLYLWQQLQRSRAWRRLHSSWEPGSFPWWQTASFSSGLRSVPQGKGWLHQQIRISVSHVLCMKVLNTADLSFYPIFTGNCFSSFLFDWRAVWSVDIRRNIFLLFHGIDTPAHCFCPLASSDHQRFNSLLINSLLNICIILLWKPKKPIAALLSPLKWLHSSLKEFWRCYISGYKRKQCRNSVQC